MVGGVAERGAAAAAPVHLGRLLTTSLPARYVCRVIAGHLFHRYFRVVAANTDALRDEVYRLRYEVYCRELGYEDPSAFPDGREIDAHDAHALHCLLLHRPSGVYAGCVRLVRPDPLAPAAPLPFEKVCAGRLWPSGLETVTAERSRIGEISRLAVPARFRRRQGEKGSPGGVLPEKGKAGRGRRTPPIALGLYLAAAAAGLREGLEGVFALMEPKLARRLHGYGIHFRQVGEAVEHRGERAPFYIDRAGLYAHISPLVRGLLEVVQRDLEKGSN